MILETKQRRRVLSGKKASNPGAGVGQQRDGSLTQADPGHSGKDAQGWEGQRSVGFHFLLPVAPQAGPRLRGKGLCAAFRRLDLCTELPVWAKGCVGSQPGHAQQTRAQRMPARILHCLRFYHSQVKEGIELGKGASVVTKIEFSIGLAGCGLE